MKKITLFFLTATVLFSVACKKQYKLEEPAEEPITDFTKLKVNPVFDWTAAQLFSLGLTIVDNSLNRVSTNALVIHLLDQDFNRIKTGITENGTLELNTKLPASVTKVYVFIPKTGNLVEVPTIISQQSMTITTEVAAPIGRAQGKNAGSPDCNTGCNRTESGTISNLIIKKNETVCLTGTLNGGITFEDKGTLKICGTANISSVNFNGSGEGNIIITESGKTTTANLNINNTKATLTNYGTLDLTNNFSLNGPATNYGKMTVAKDFAINAQGSFINAVGANMQIKGNFQANNTCTNNGTMTVSGELSVNSNTKLTNTHSLTVSSHFNLNSEFVNTGYTSIGGDMRCNGNGKLTLGSLSMISLTSSTSTLTINGNVSVTCSGEGAVIQVKGATTINNIGSVVGKLDIPTVGKLSTNGKKLSGNVYFGNSGIYIPASAFNPEGYGKPAIIDTDADGIEDRLDEYPKDATRAFTSYEPYIGYKVNAFEDLWPSRGDYDFNDVVVKSRTTYIYNAKNELVSSETEMILSAMGGSIKKGLSVQFLNYTTDGITAKYSQFDIKKYVSSIENLKGKAKPVLAEKAVNSINITENLFSVQSAYYSNDGLNASGVPDTMRFKVNYSSGMTVIGKTNIIMDLFLSGINKEGLVYEIHAADRPATSAVDMALYGTFEDDTKPTENRWYKTINNLPWGIEIYTGSNDFIHPSLTNSILQAYPQFVKWASSGGLDAKQWYLYPEEKLIFKK